VLRGDFSEESGYRAGRQLLSMSERPDAIFAANDMMAIGCLFALNEGGLKVPGDIAIAGFGNEDFSACLTPALTTVQWPLRTLAQRGVDLLVNTVDNPDAEPQHQVLSSELVIREST
jgi:LacI family transcriptional regulator